MSPASLATSVPVPPRPPGADVWPVRHGGRALVAVAVGDRVVVVDGRCPHQGGPLAEGSVEAGRLVCPWHLYAFDLESGRCASGTSRPIEIFPVEERDGRLWARVTPRRPESLTQTLRRLAAGG